MRTSIPAALAIATLMSGCRSDPPADIDENQNQLIAGFRADGKSLDAVGTVGVRGFDGSYQFFCSATLIAPQVVLTAKHCAILFSGFFKGIKIVNTEPVFFAVGPDANRPAKIVEAIAADTSPVDLGGIVGLGNDVAVYHLKEPVTGVTPLPVSTVSFTPADIGTRYMGVGFGSKDLLEDAFGFLTAQRRAGYMTLRALGGQPWHTIFPTFQDFVNEFRFLFGDELVQFLLPQIREFYDSTILGGGYEAWVGLSSNQRASDGTADAQSCHGDSGGPLLTRGAYRSIVGVVSGGFFSRQLPCDHGTFYATMGAKTHEMLAAALTYRDPCAGGHTVEGSCDGTIATRCTDKFEGDRRLSQIDCADLGLECRRDGRGVVGCFDEGAVIDPPRPDGGAGGGHPDGGAPPPPDGGRPPGQAAPSIDDIRQAVRAVEDGKHRFE
jgi:hypothetical protein